MQVYPPGVMERTNQQTKQAYRIKSVEGHAKSVWFNVSLLFMVQVAWTPV